MFNHEALHLFMIIITFIHDNYHIYSRKLFDLFMILITFIHDLSCFLQYYLKPATVLSKYNKFGMPSTYIYKTKHNEFTCYFCNAFLAGFPMFGISLVVSGAVWGDNVYYNSIAFNSTKHRFPECN